MTALDIVLQWLGSESAILVALGDAFKCSHIVAVGLLLTYFMPRNRFGLRNLILRQVVLLGILLPVVALSGLVTKLFDGVAESVTWQISLPAMTGEAISDGIGTVSADTDWSVQAVVLLVILTGCLVALVRIGYGIHLLLRTQRQSNISESTAITNIIERAKSRARIGSAVQVAFSKQAIVPFAGGTFRHIVILPEVAKDWKERDLEMVLLHEFLHIERRDFHWAFIGSLATALNWYNPLVWLAHRKMILEAEHCCDSGVVKDGSNASDYAGLLVRLARSTRDHSVSVAFSSQILGMKLLEVRIMSILQTEVRDFRTSARLRRSVLLCTFMLLIPVATMRLTGADRSKAGSTDKSGNSTVADSANWPSPDEFVDVDFPPEIIKSGMPTYPDSLRRAGIEGSVWVRVLVDTTGAIAKAVVQKTSGHKEMDDAALTAASKSIFKPALSGGAKVRLWVSYEIKFQLKQK